MNCKLVSNSFITWKAWVGFGSFHGIFEKKVFSASLKHQAYISPKKSKASANIPIILTIKGVMELKDPEVL